MPIVNEEYWPTWQVDLSRDYELEDHAINNNDQRVWGDRHYAIYWQCARTAEEAGQHALMSANKEYRWRVERVHRLARNSD